MGCYQGGHNIFILAGASHDNISQRSFKTYSVIETEGCVDRDKLESHC